MRLRDATSQARLKVMLAAVGKQRMSPQACLDSLGDAYRVFRASELHIEARIARCEAAGHLLDNWCAAEALQLLQHRDGMTPDDPQGVGMAESAKEALCWLDLGDLPQAGAAALRVLSGLQAWPAAPEPLTLLRARVLAVDVLTAAVLVAERRLDCSLGDTVWPPTPGAMTPAPDATLMSQWHAVALGAVVGRAEAEFASQHLLLVSLRDAAAALPAAQALVTRLSAKSQPMPSAWLRVAICFRLLGRPVLAAHCAREALSGAQAIDSLRWQRMALLELAHVQGDVGQDGMRETWNRMRLIERAARDFALRFRRGWGAAVNGPAAVVRGPAAEPVSPRRLHLESAMALLNSGERLRWSVAALAEACGVSRRTLEQAFRIEAGTTVSDALKRARLERALELLRHSDDAVKRVALDSGFSSPSALCREIKRHTGLSPGAIRLRARSEARALAAATKT